MDLNKESKLKNNIRIVLLCAFIILFAVSIYRIWTGASDNYWGLIAPVIFIVLLSLQIRTYHSSKNLNSDSNTKDLQN